VPVVSAGVPEDTRDRIDEKREPDESRSATIRRFLMERTDPETEIVELPAETVDAVRERQRDGEPFEDAARRLLADGIEESDRPDGVLIDRWGAVQITGLVAALLAFGSVDDTLGYVGLGLFVGVALARFSRRRGWI
jgi:hypothetical protein